MIHIKDILTLNRTLYRVSVNSKKKAFEIIAESLAESVPSLSANVIFDKLIERERLGSTSIGHGVAIPHARLEEIDKPLGCFLFLKEGIDFDAEEHAQINMIFTLVVPKEAIDEHLELLSTLAYIFSQESFRKDLLQASSKEDLYSRLIRE